jgi:hypothetical protein
MQRIERGGYSQDEILDVLHSRNGTRKVHFRYDLLDKNGVYKKTLGTVLSGEVSMSAFSTIKRTAKFKIKERYIPEHVGREKETKNVNYDTQTDWNSWSGTGVATSSAGALRIATPANSVAPSWAFASTEFNADGTPVGWTKWGGSLGIFSSSTIAITGDASAYIYKNSTTSGSIGIQTESKSLLSVVAGDVVYVSFFFHGDFTPTYTYLMRSTGSNNLSFGGSGTYTITDIGSGWSRFDGQMVMTDTASFGLLIGFSTSSTGACRIDNVYFQKNEAPIYEAVGVSPEVDFSDSTFYGNDNARLIATYIDYDKDYGDWNSSHVGAPDNSFYTRFSLDGGTTWSAWQEQGETGIVNLPQGTDVSQLKLQFRWTGERYYHNDIVGFNYLDVVMVYERDTIIPETTEINYLSDRIQPFMEVQMPDGRWIDFPLGVFLLSTPTRHDEVNGVFRDIEAYDGLIILDDDKFTSRYNIPAGTKYTKAVEDILKSAGITRFNIQDKGDTLSTAKEFKIGTSKLQAVNELLSSINYTPIWVDATGYFTAYPYVSPADRRADYTYQDDELSVIYDGMEEELDLTETANSWVVTQSNPEKEPLVSTKTNDNPDSPTSTVNMGRTIVDFREVDDISDQATLDAYVERIAFEASQVFGKLKFKTALMPFHEYADVLHIKYDALKIDYKFSETNWTMKLEAGGEMEHEVRRVVNI